MTGTLTRGSSFLDAFEERARDLERRGPGWLAELRRASRRRFESTGFPTSRDEEWKNTNPAPISGATWAPAVPGDRGETAGPFEALSPAALLRFDAGRSTSVRSDLPDGCFAGSLHDVPAELQERLREALTSRDPAGLAAFAALNSALWEDGAFVWVPPGVELERPIMIAYHSNAGDPLAVQHPRTVVVAGRASKFLVVEAHLGDAGATYLSNSASDLVLDEGAQVEHMRWQLEAESAFHVSTQESRQGRDSDYRSLGVDLGGRLVRHDVRAQLQGPGARCRLDGLYVTRGNQHVDNHTVLDHAKPHCDSRELYKGVLAGRSRGVFNGRIVVRQDAQKTDAKQSNPNLLLSGEALAHTRPQLEIYADDVKCTHGATIGRLQEEAVFYLRSRGIPESEATELLVRAFAAEAIERAAAGPARDWIAERVVERLGSLTRG